MGGEGGGKGNGCRGIGRGEGVKQWPIGRRAERRGEDGKKRAGKKHQEGKGHGNR